MLSKLNFITKVIKLVLFYKFLGVCPFMARAVALTVEV